MSKLFNKIKILGLSAVSIASGLTLSGCSKRELIDAQQNMDNAVVELINQNQNSNIKYFSFLGANINSNGQTFDIDINGIATDSSKVKAYTTLNYTVNNFNYKLDEKSDKYKNNAQLINMLADVVKNEILADYSMLKVDDVKTLNTTTAKVTNSNLDEKYKCQGNFLYAVNNLNFNEQEQFASFSTKELIKYAKSEVNYWAFTENGPIYTIDADRKTFYVDQNIYVELTPEEISQAKNNSAIVFNKFAEYVNSNQTEKYVVEQTEMSENQELGIVMNEEISLN